MNEGRLIRSSHGQNYIIRMSTPDDDGSLTEQTNNTLNRLALNLRGSARVCTESLLVYSAPNFSVQKDYEEDFLSSKLTLTEYVQRLQRWRDRYEKHLDSRPRLQSLDILSHYLIEFQYGKFDDIEVPGQYTEVGDAVNYSPTYPLIWAMINTG